VIDDQLVHNPHELIQISFQRKKEKQKESKKALPSVKHIILKVKVLYRK
jgi:hypothetical protein